MQVVTSLKEKRRENEISELTKSLTFITSFQGTL